MTLEGELAHRANLMPVAPPRHPSLCDKAGRPVNVLGDPALDVAIREATLEQDLQEAVGVFVIGERPLLARFRVGDLDKLVLEGPEPRNAFQGATARFQDQAVVCFLDGLIPFGCEARITGAEGVERALSR